MYYVRTCVLVLVGLITETNVASFFLRCTIAVCNCNGPCGEPTQVQRLNHCAIKVSERPSRLAGTLHDELVAKDVLPPPYTSVLLFIWGAPQQYLLTCSLCHSLYMNAVLLYHTTSLHHSSWNPMNTSGYISE